MKITSKSAMMSVNSVMSFIMLGETTHLVFSDSSSLSPSSSASFFFLHGPHRNFLHSRRHVPFIAMASGCAACKRKRKGALFPT